MPPNDKVCMVCGDKALGYNFNAVTCESCKAFFRRNALSSKEFSCPFNENCDITVITRRFCQKCRLEKCFSIGMRKEYIMSEEDKILKKIKIEQNRAKRKPTNSFNGVTSSTPLKIKREYEAIVSDGKDNWSVEQNLEEPDLDPMTPSPTISPDSNSPVQIFPNVTSEFTIINSPPCSAISSSTNLIQENTKLLPTASKSLPNIDSSSAEIVDRLVEYPEDTTKLINHLMKTPTDAVYVMTKILNSQKDAMRLIGHLIGAPGDALKIISKIMNSPFDALTVFTKFMSSPTDALEIIAKIASSPGEVLQFIQQLMNSPEDALQIMNKFMNSPAEALKMLNKMVNNPNVDSTTASKEDADDQTLAEESNSKNNPMIKSILDNAHQQDTVDALNGIRITCDSNKTATNSDNSATLRNLLSEIDEKPIEPNSLESIICDAIKLEYERTTLNPKIQHTANTTNPTSHNSKDLNDAERAKLNELIVANKALYAPLDEDLSGLDECSLNTNPNSQDPQLLKIINLTAIAIRRLIKMSKKINAFKNMCQEDQVALLKGGCTEMMILRSAMQYDGDHATWKVSTKIPHSQEAMSSISTDVLKLAKGNVYEEHESFIRTFELKWRKDENIILILSAIVLFTPTRPKTIHIDVLKLEQNSYYYLLRRYLESVYPGCEAKDTFLKLIKKIKELQRLNEVIVGVYLDVNPRQVEPLLREIFDLKNH